jgi:hypothetical protein
MSLCPSLLALRSAPTLLISAMPWDLLPVTVATGTLPDDSAAFIAVVVALL